MHRILRLLAPALCLLVSGPWSPAPASPATAAPRAPGPLYHSDQLVLSKEQVAGVLLTDDFIYTVTLEARRDLDDILLTEELPEGVTLVSAEPAPGQVSGRILCWRIPRLAAAAKHTVTLTVNLEDEGSFVTKTRAIPDPMATLPLAAGLPKLEIVKTGPEFAEYGSDFTFDITVRNTGNAVARNVWITEIPPPALSMGNFIPELGDIPAGHSRNVTILARAQNKGSHTNLARAFQDANPVPAESSATVKVVESRLGLSQTGPSVAWISRPARWTTTVRNDGECPVNDIVIRHPLPYGLRPTDDLSLSTPAGSTWQVGTLHPGQSRSFDLMLTSDAPRKATGRATVTGVAVTGRTLDAEASVTTVWEAAPGVLATITDTTDPVRIGNSTTYMIVITNQADLRAISPRLKLSLSEHLRPVQVIGRKADIAGQTVDFGEIALDPHGRAELRVIASGVRPGTGKATLGMEADFLGTPIVKEESTHVY
ncbi:hypothetical protein OPIT5_04705 [Opitutaceae bacterium TAV5]|nr:hypothetical protein OPIT5_04705 [Opitutaceae bacterium TAV5]